MDIHQNKKQLCNAMQKLDEILSETNWAMLFPNTDDTVVFIEAKAKVMEAKKKFAKIASNLEG